ncbi:hypothetical protein PDESU_01944 [Pontiella desulfatans]|uniref:Uncharacterized protein n=1 Tax=Pontiella desulfatans TaxID=2750659 RepID=A0A6C2U0I7_PONDE|nr:hypothetical protein [Pontiella desulfatans]VGO13387.1 hypothetical protein PDESU_01944 [Pontiella desulfatans]
MSEELIMLHKDASRKDETQFIKYIAANCHPNYQIIVKIAHWFFKDDIRALLNDEYKTLLLKRLRADNPTELILSLVNKLDCNKGEGKQVQIEPFNFLRDIDNIDEAGKLALSDVLQSVFSQGLTHDGVYDFARQCLIEHAIKKKDLAFSIIEQNSASGLPEIAIRNIVRFAINNSLEMYECEAFFWQLNSAAHRLKSHNIPVAKHLKNAYPPSLLVQLATTSDIKKNLDHLKKLAVEIGTENKSALQIFGWCVKEAYVARYEANVDEHYDEDQNFLAHLAHIEGIFSHPTFWNELSSVTSKIRSITATKKYPSRLEALREFCRICYINKLLAGNKPALSRGTDVYIAASDFLRHSIGLHKETFENDLKGAYRIAQLEIEHGRNDVHLECEK